MSLSYGPLMQAGAAAGRFNWEIESGNCF